MSTKEKEKSFEVIHDLKDFTNSVFFIFQAYLQRPLPSKHSAPQNHEKVTLHALSFTILSVQKNGSCTDICVAINRVAPRPPFDLISTSDMDNRKNLYDWPLFSAIDRDLHQSSDSPPERRYDGDRCQPLFNA